MSIWGRAKAKADELLGRAEEVYGQSHGDAAAIVGGEARRLEGEAEAEAEAAEEKAAGRRTDRPDDDGLAGVR
jgi:uncharacterized protein YjbJ (UPF0337 family)